MRLNTERTIQSSQHDTAPPMFTRRFTNITDSDLGEGYGPAWLQNVDPVSGFGAAHDFLEHLPNCIGGFEGEMMAFGAMHFVRRSYDWNLGCIETAQCSDIGNFFREVVHGQQTLKEPPPTNLRYESGTRARFCGDDMHGELVYLFEEQFAKNWLNSDETEAATWVKENAELHADRIVGWMERGFIRAANRYERRGLDQFEMGYIFEQAKEAFDRVERHAEPEYEDILLSLDYSTKTVSAKIVQKVSQR